MPTGRDEDDTMDRPGAGAGDQVERPSPAWWSQWLLTRPAPAPPAVGSHERAGADPMALLARSLCPGRPGDGDGEDGS
jgi:hypothetical protein